MIYFCNSTDLFLSVYFTDDNMLLQCLWVHLHSPTPQVSRGCHHWPLPLSSYLSDGGCTRKPILASTLCSISL